MGISFRGYQAGESGPGVIVIQEWWGLVGHIRNLVDRFAEAGFIALAPDLYDGIETDEPDEAGKLMMALDIHRAEEVLRGAIRHLQGLCCGNKVGVVGFCMGGQLALFAAATNPENVGACVDFYGIHPNVQPPFENLKAPVMGFFAELDGYADPATVARLSEALAAAGAKHEFVTYPGRQHAFFNDDRPSVYDANAAADAWAKMTAFFRENLGGPDA